MAQADKIWRGRNNDRLQLLRDPSQQDTWFVSLPSSLALSRRLWGLQRRPAAAQDEFLVSKEEQLPAAVAPRGFALPQHLNLMSSDAGNRTGSAGLASVPAHPDDTVA